MIGIFFPSQVAFILHQDNDVNTKLTFNYACTTWEFALLSNEVKTPENVITWHYITIQHQISLGMLVLFTFTNDTGQESS